MQKPRIIRAMRACAVFAALLCMGATAVIAAPGERCAGGRHQYIETRRVEPTATTDGEADYLCTECGQRYTDILFATEHLWGGWIIDKPASCTQPGSKRRTCTRARPHDETSIIAALGHSYTVSATEPGCDSEGEITYRCKRCANWYTETIPPVGHDYAEEIAREATCMVPGLMLFVCANDFEHSYEEGIPALGHAYGEWQVKTPAAPDAQGLEARVCLRCGDGETRPLPAPAIPTTRVFTAIDAALAGTNVLSLGFFAFLLIPYFISLAYIKRRQKAVKRRNALRKELEERYGFY